MDKPSWEKMLVLNEKALYQEIMKCPVLYLGTLRLDYLHQFMSGFYMHRTMNELANVPVKQLERGWDADYEMQRWIFLQNAAALCPGVSLNGWTLFYRCYGVKEEAMSRFSQFLHADLPAPPAEKSLDPFHPQNTMGDIWESVRQLENDDDDSHGEQVKALVRQLIRETGAVCDEIRLYVRRDHYFRQVRFVYHTPQGWREDNDLRDEAHYIHWVKLHALVECLSDRERQDLWEHGAFYCTLADQEILKDEGVMDIGHTLRDKDTLEAEYCRWRDHFTASY